MCLSSSLSLTGVLRFELFTNWASCHRYFFCFNEILPSDLSFVIDVSCSCHEVILCCIYLIIEIYFQMDSPKVQNYVYNYFYKVNIWDISQIAKGVTLNINTTRQEVVTNNHKIQFKLICDHQEHFGNLISQEAMFFRLSNAEKWNIVLFWWIFKLTMLANTQWNMHTSFDQIPLSMDMNYESMKGTVTD